MKNALRMFVVLCLGSGLTACSLDVGDLNNPAVDEFTENPTAESVHAAAIGLAIGNSRSYADAIGFLAQTGILGREVRSLNANDPRDITELVLTATPSAGDTIYGGGNWLEPYKRIVAGHFILEALPNVAELSAEAKEGISGWTKFWQANEFYWLLHFRPDGAPIDVFTQELAPFESGATVSAHIVTLLEESEAHLAGAGDMFSFALPSGFDAFNTPAGFSQVAAGMRARALVDAGDFDGALSALGSSFLTDDPMDPQLSLGAYHTYGTDAGQTQNALISPWLFAHPRLRDDIQGGDARLAKLVDVDDAMLMVGDDTFTASDAFTIYGGPTASIPIIRNEELILLRAEANWGLDDLDAAKDDLNFIRDTAGGGLPNLPMVMTSDEVREALYYERSYSLMFEGHSWGDARRLGMLEMLPDGEPCSEFPVPQAEQDARQ
jgi:hypothetical protein